MGKTEMNATREHVLAMAKDAGATIYADTIIVNGKDADDFVSSLVHLAQQFMLDQLRATCHKKWVYARVNSEQPEEYFALPETLE